MCLLHRVQTSNVQWAAASSFLLPTRPSEILASLFIDHALNRPPSPRWGPSHAKLLDQVEKLVLKSIVEVKMKKSILCLRDHISFTQPSLWKRRVLQRQDPLCLGILRNNSTTPHVRMCLASASQVRLCLATALSHNSSRNCSTTIMSSN